MKEFQLLKSNNGKDFEIIKFVKATGNSFNNQTYFITDNTNSEENIVYYKIRAIDIDGNSESTPIFSTQYSTKNIGIDVFPNPYTQGELYIRSHDDDSEFMIELYDLAGKIISINTIKDVKAGSIYNIGNLMNNLPKGEYLLKTISDHSVNCTKLVLK